MAISYFYFITTFYESGIMLSTYQLFVAVLLIHWYYFNIKLNYFSSRATVELEN